MVREALDELTGVLNPLEIKTKDGPASWRVALKLSEERGLPHPSCPLQKSTTPFNLLQELINEDCTTNE